MSEKFDGVRAHWDGDGALWSKQGNKFEAPDWFFEDFPAGIPLDGELWVGRGDFEGMNSIRKTRRKPEKWETVRFMVFDMPSTKAVEERIADIKTIFELRPPKYARRAVHIQCSGKQDSRFFQTFNSISAICLLLRPCRQNGIGMANKESRGEKCRRAHLARSRFTV